MSVLRKARWGTTADALRAGLISREGIVCGETLYLRRPVSLSASEHVCVVAPPGAGKGATGVIPTGLQCPLRSLVIVDPKSEIETKTRSVREQCSTVLRFDPAPEEHELAELVRYNPLDFIRSTHAFTDASELAMAIVGHGPAEAEFWYTSARSLCTGLILFLLERCAVKGLHPTLSMLPRLLMDPKRTREELFRAMSRSKNESAAEVGAGMLNVQVNAAEQATGTIETLLSALEVFRDPLVAHAFSASDFKPQDLQYSYRPITLYIRVAPLDMRRYAPAIRVLLTSIGSALLRRLDVGDDGQESRRRQLTWVVDEAYMFGRWEFLLNAMPVCRGYKQNFYLIYQTVERIHATYGSLEILSMCAAVLFLSVNSKMATDYITDRLGKAEKAQKTVTRNAGSTSTSTTMIQRDLITPAQVGLLPVLRPHALLSPRGITLMVTSSGRPYLLRQRPYWLDRAFRRLLGMPTGIPRLISWVRRFLS